MEKPKIDKKKIVIVIAIASIVIFYLAGLVCQLQMPAQVSTNGWGYTKKESVSFNPVKCVYYALSTQLGWKSIFMVTACSGALFAVVKLCTQKNPMEDERNFVISAKGTYGTSGWMTKEDISANFDVKTVSQTTGTILGMLNNKIVSLPMSSKLNKHTAIYGASGTGKSRCFVRPQIIQCSSREIKESLIITDPKGELYADTAQFLRNRGYTVRVFNLVNPQHGDSWNCLQEINSQSDQLELMSQTFADVIIKNTSPAGGGGGKDPFWDNAEMNLLKALCLLVLSEEQRTDAYGNVTGVRTHEQVNIGAVYELLTSSTYSALEHRFSMLAIDHPARKPWTIFCQGSENVRGNVMISLGSRLQVFQSPDIVNITSYDHIDLELPAREPTVIYVIMSDQDSTLDFLSSLMFSFLFIRLVRYADFKSGTGKCKVPVNFILDEFPNIGQIPDFCKKLSTIRSRDLRVAVIFQNVAQLQNRYPNGLWEEIIGNCDTQLFLGCTDATTAKFISERTGIMTIEVESNSTKRKALSPVSSNPEYGVSQSIGKRNVLTPDEVMRLPNSNALILLRGQKILKVDKFDFSLHPVSKEFTFSLLTDYEPLWVQKKREQFSETPAISDTSNTDANHTAKDLTDSRANTLAAITQEEKKSITTTRPQLQKTPVMAGTASARPTETIISLDGRQRPSVAQSRHKFMGDVDKYAARERSKSVYTKSDIPVYVYKNAKTSEPSEGAPPEDF